MQQMDKNVDTCCAADATSMTLGHSAVCDSDRINIPRAGEKKKMDTTRMSRARPHVTWRAFLN